MTGLFTQYPSPVAPGGLRQGRGNPALRSLASNDMRQPELFGRPTVASVTGLDGAGIVSNGSEADQSQGMVEARAGVSPGASGVIVIAFPATPAALVFMADWATLTATPSGSDVSIAWTASRPILPHERLRLAYQWSVSQ